MAATYEYQILSLTGSDPHGGDLASRLRELGSQGWRLVGIENRYLFMERETAAERAASAVADARATLAVADQHQRAAQHAVEEAIRLAKPVPQPSSNGHDRHYLTDRVNAAEQAQKKFDA